MPLLNGLVDSSDMVNISSGGLLALVSSNNSYSVLPTPLYLSESEVLSLVFFLALFGFTGVMENMLVILSVVLNERHLEVPSNIFLLSLTCADFLICGVSAPLLIYNCFNWIFDIFITVSKFVVVATAGSIFLLTFNRLASIMWPLKNHHIITIARSILMVAVIWLVAAVVAIAAIISIIYDVPWLNHITRYFLTFYIIASSVMYIYMYYLARKHRRQLRQQVYAVTGQVRGAIHEFRALKTLCMVAGTFLACWFPMTVSFFITNRYKAPVKFHRVFSFTGPLVVVNAVLDPIIYYYRARGFRLSIRKIIKRIEILFQSYGW